MKIFSTDAHKSDQEMCGSDINSYFYDTKAFLFRLGYRGKETPSKFPVKKPEYAIRNYSAGYGPVFGDGHDIYTFSGSLSCQNNVYTLNGSFDFNNSYDTGGLTTDQINGNIKTVTDLEVYGVADVEFRESWRETGNWDLATLESLKTELDSYCPPPGTGTKSSRILLLGPIGSGKSSFFNTIASVFRGHVTSQAVCGSAEHSFTTKYRIYRVRGSSAVQPLKFRMCDTRRLEETQGIDASEINYLLEGNVPDGYQFNPATSISADIPGFISSPKLDDKIHCVGFVIDGSTATVLSDKMLDRIKSLQVKVGQKGVPQVILLTKIDKVCYQVEKDVASTFQSEAIRNLVEKVSDIFGVPRNHVLPVKNYEKEIEIKDDVSILALIALRQLLRSCDDFLFNFLDTLDNKKDAERFD